MAELNALSQEIKDTFPIQKEMSLHQNMYEELIDYGQFRYLERLRRIGILKIPKEISFDPSILKSPICVNFHDDEKNILVNEKTDKKQEDFINLDQQDEEY